MATTTNATKYPVFASKQAVIEYIQANIMPQAPAQARDLIMRLNATVTSTFADPEYEDGADAS